MLLEAGLLALAAPGFVTGFFAVFWWAASASEAAASAKVGALASTALGLRFSSSACIAWKASLRALGEAEAGKGRICSGRRWGDFWRQEQ